MTIPAITKWKPKVITYRNKHLGWQMFVYQHTDHNPVIVISRWCGFWFLECYGKRWTNEPRLK